MTAMSGRYLMNLAVLSKNALPHASPPMTKSRPCRTRQLEPASPQLPAAVPRIPIRCTLVNGRLLDDEPRRSAADDAAADTDRQGHRRPGGVARRKTGDDRSGKVGQDVGHHGARGR